MNAEKTMMELRKRQLSLTTEVINPITWLAIDDNTYLKIGLVIMTQIKDKIRLQLRDHDVDVRDIWR